MAERTIRPSDKAPIRISWCDITIGKRYELRIPRNPREDNKPLTNKPPEMSEDSSWEFIEDATSKISFYAPGASVWEYKGIDSTNFYQWRYIHATENGWISADHDPPTGGKYLVYYSNIWSTAYWDDGKWLSVEPVTMWKPVLTPEKPEDPERFKIVPESSFSVSTPNYGIEDSESDYRIMGLSSNQAEELAGFLNEQFKNQCQCS